jgi:transcriptional regulator with AAA-type ATPase domain
MVYSIDTLVQAAERLVKNPFEADGTAWVQAQGTLMEGTSGRLDGDLARACSPADLELLVLALGHVQACRRDTQQDTILSSAQVDRRVWKRMLRPRKAYLRMCAAAGRCAGVLGAILGGSTNLARVRSQTWAACFGDSLVHALSLERVIHDHDVLILGETGTGKETVARAIQAGTPGPDDGTPPPHAAINAAAVPATLVESELFGHVRGAFTGAAEARVGRLRSANGGTFFLDEVGDLELHTQVKLLRVMETNEVTPVGADHGEQVNVRYVAATHGDLETEIENGEFRRDLYQRLAGIVIRIPPLRERPEDIIDIGRAFVRSYLPKNDDDRIERWLESASRRQHRWSGNVRELQNALRNLLLGLEPALDDAGSGQIPATGPTLPAPIAQSRATLREVEDWYIRRVLEHEENNFAAAARRLGLDRSTVRRRSRE